jgi:hypothetical protein
MGRDFTGMPEMAKRLLGHVDDLIIASDEAFCHGVFSAGQKRLRAPAAKLSGSTKETGHAENTIGSARSMDCLLLADGLRLLTQSGHWSLE